MMNSRICATWILYFIIVPVSALSGQAIQKIDSLTLLLESQPGKNTIRVNLLNQIGFEYWTVDPQQSEKFGLEAKNIAQELDYVEGMAMADRVIGVSHWSRGEFFKSLTHLFEGRDLYKSLNDTLGEANCVMNIGLVYADQKDYGRALENFQYAIQLFENLGRIDRIGITYNKIGTVYLERGEFDKAEQYLNEALKIHQDLDFSFGIMEAANRLGLLYREEGNYSTAKNFLNNSFELAEENKDQEHIIKNLENLASIAIRENEYDLAKMYLDQVMPMAQNNQYLKWLRDIYKDYRDIYLEKKDYRLALEYYEQYESIKDRIFNQEKSAQIANLELEYQTAQQQQALRLRDQEFLYLQQQARAERLINIILAAGFILLIIAAYLIFRYQRYRFRQNQILSSRDAQLAKIELENARLREDELKQSLEFKNRELTSYTINFIRKNELIENLREKINSLQTTIPDKSAELNSLSNLIQLNSTIDKDWEDFRRTFENVHHQFFSRLLQFRSDLTQAELRLCALVCLNLSIKEMASLMGISPDSVKTARYRLRKKFNLDQEQNLADFVLGFTKN